MMNDEQKRYKILKRTSYEEQISQENKKVIESTLMLGLGAALTICALAQIIDVDNTDIIQLMNYAGVFASSTVSATYLKMLIDAISKRTMLQGKIEDINTELEMLKIEESRNMRR